VRTTVFPPGDRFVDSIDGTAATDGQVTWLFVAGAGAAMGFVIAVVAAQATQALDVEETKLPLIGVVLATASGLSLAAAVRWIPAAARACLGSAGAGLMAGIAIVAMPASLGLFPGSFLAGAGVAVLTDREQQSRVRAASGAVFVAAVAVALAVAGGFR
jgi:hypothetical protein